MIRVESLSKHYGQRQAVNDLNFEVQRGEIVGFLGPNGAGKSSTLRMLTGYFEPTAGRIWIDGVDALENPVEARKRIGYMPESVPLHVEMRVEEYLRFRAELKGVARSAIAKNLDRALEQAAITDVRKRIIGQLSKGYRQRVGLADALIADPPLLILDEPTAGLDPNQIRQVRDLILGLAGQKTVLLSTHILPEVESTCARVLILHKGRLVASGPTADVREKLGASTKNVLVVRARARREEIEAALNDVQGIDGLLDAHAADDITTARFRCSGDDASIERAFTALGARAIAVREFRREQSSLEDVFAELTTAEASS